MIDKNDPRLTGFVLGELDAEDRQTVQAAIDQSPELAAEVESIRAAVTVLSGIYENEPKLALRDEQKQNVASNADPTATAVPKTDNAGGSKVDLAIDPVLHNNQRNGGRWWSVAAVVAGIALLAAGNFYWAGQYTQGNVAKKTLPPNAPSTNKDKEVEPAVPALAEVQKPDEVPEIVDLIQSTIAPNEWDKDEAEDKPQQVPNSGLVILNGQEVVDESGLEQDSIRGHSILSDRDRRFESGDLAAVGNETRLNEGVEFKGSLRSFPADRGGYYYGPQSGQAGEEERVAEFLSGGEVPITGKRGEIIRFENRTRSVPARSVPATAFPNPEDGRRSKKPREKFTARLAGKDSNGDVDEGSQSKRQQGQGDGLSSPAGTTGTEVTKSQPATKVTKPKIPPAPTKPRSWKRVKAIPNTSRLMVGDREELTMTGMQAHVQIDGFRARVLVDYFFYNGQHRPLEGNFKLRLPDDVSLYYFAFGESAYQFDGKGPIDEREFIGDRTEFVSLGASDIKNARQDLWRNVKEAQMVPREKAAFAFRETVRRRIDPALVEWSGAGVFNAKVFPLTPKKLHRIVVGYDVNLTTNGNQLSYQLDLPEQTGTCKIEIDVRSIEGQQCSITPTIDPIEIQNNGDVRQRFTFNDRPDQPIRVVLQNEKQLLLKSTGEDQNFWATQITPQLPSETSGGRQRAIFLVDVSLSSNPDKFQRWLDLLTATLENNRKSLKQFGVVFFNVDAHFWRKGYIDNTTENVKSLKNDLQSLILEGATDLYRAIDLVKETPWVSGTTGAADGGDTSTIPDLFLLSDGAANWGETNLRLIDQLVQDQRLGSLFAYQTGLAGTAISNLRFLADRSGGAVFSVTSEDQIKPASVAHRQRPWRLKSISAEGAQDVLTAGRVQWVYPGQTLTVVGRGKIDADAPIKVAFEQAGQTLAANIHCQTIASDLTDRTYGQIAVGQLESLGERVFDISTAYARHFRITGQTCSLLMLESEADYQRFGIQPEEDRFVVKAKSAAKIVESTIEKFAGNLASPQAQLLTWLKRLETMPGMEFKMPTSLRLALDEIKVEAISQPLDCQLAYRSDVSSGYLKSIGRTRLDYDAVAVESHKRSTKSLGDAVKVLSSLVERQPNDIAVARDVAFSAMELDRPAAAYHLLKKITRTRPFQGNIYPALGQCLAQMGKSDMAIIYYEIALGGQFQRQGNDFRKIVTAHYMHLLRQIVSGKRESAIKSYAQARLQSLGKNLPFGKADLLITMMWNQDQTDVDLHVIEPSGEECFYSNNRTRSGGAITADITTGFGPEMYFNANAPHGKYDVQVKFFGSGQNRVSLKNKVYLSIYRHYGSADETLTRRTVELKTVGKKEPVIVIGVDP